MLWLSLQQGQMAASVVVHPDRSDVGGELNSCLHMQGVPLEDVTRVLRQRFGTSGIAEKAARRQRHRLGHDDDRRRNDC